MNQLPEKKELVIEGIKKDIGGFSVRRILPSNHKRSVGPFIFFDHMGPADLDINNGMAVRPHPHIGLSTITYLFEGCIIHRDSLGYKQSINPGEVNWMTAGRGIVHSERTPKDPATFVKHMNGLQIWIALPKEFEEIEPSFTNFPSSALPKFEINDIEITVILGEVLGYKSPVPIHSKLFYFDTKFKSGSSLDLKFGEKEEFAVYLADGQIKIGEQIIEPFQMVIFKPGEEITITANQDSRLVVIGGEPFAETRYMWWNLVSSSKARIEKAKHDWLNMNMGQVIEETEFIPLPEDGYPVLYP